MVTIHKLKTLFLLFMGKCTLIFLFSNLFGSEYYAATINFDKLEKSEKNPCVHEILIIISSSYYAHVAVQLC